MAQKTIRNADGKTLARGRFPDRAKSGRSEEEAWAAMERIWEAMKSETPVKVSSADIIREGRGERWARIDPRMAELERAEREGK